MATTGYNLNHLQVGAKVASPVYKDVNYATTAEFGIDQQSDTFKADGGSKVTTYGAREGSGSYGFGSADLSTIALMSGDPFTTTGTDTAKIDRLEIGGSTTPPPLIFSAWVPNVDGNQASAGLRITVPNGTVTVPSTTYEQESWTEFDADLSFVEDENGVMLIFEDMATAPTITSGVMPVNLVAPA